MISFALLAALVAAYAGRVARAVRMCPREKLGYRCHAAYPGGCEECGRIVEPTPRPVVVPSPRRPS